MKSINIFWIGISGVALFIFTTILGSLLNANYQSSSQLISELYATNAPNAALLKYTGYIPSGLLVASFCLYCTKVLPKSTLNTIGFLGIGIFYGLGTVICSLFPLDEINKDNLLPPSSSELIHEFTGLLTYLITPISLLLIGINANKWKNGKFVAVSGMLCGAVTIYLVGKFLANMNAPNIGIIQRIIEGIILLWIIICAFYVKDNADKLEVK